MLKLRQTALFCAMLSVAGMAGAESVEYRTYAGNMSFVLVNNPGNLDDEPRNGVFVGAVDYSYGIGTYEVNAGSYASFLNAVAGQSADEDGVDDLGLYVKAMADGKNAGPIVTWDKSSSNYSVSGASKPIGYVDWRDAARFCNWLTTGDTENGVYNFRAPGIGVMDHLAAAEAFGTAFFLPTEDEWYKAAYHKNNGVSGDYWVYPTGSDQEPADVGSDAFSTGYANYHTGDSDLVAVDAAGSASPYGTIGQGGNVYEWTESVFLGENDRIYRGGSSINLNTTQMESRNRQNNSRTFARWDIGFRIGAIGPDLGFEPGGNDPIVPEPATVTLYGLGLAGLVTVRVARSRGRS